MSARRVPCALLCSLFLISALAHAHAGRVVDAATGLPLSGAVVTSGSMSAVTDTGGRYSLQNAEGTVVARAIGHRRGTLPSGAVENAEIRLDPIKPKALYLSFWGVGDRGLRGQALDLIGTTELNALVIDVKGDRGGIPYPSRVQLAQTVGARRNTTVADMPALVAQLKAAGIYLIARIVVFKDEPLAAARPELAVRTAQGAAFHDREGLGWVDPFRREVWDYNLDIAAEAAKLGFDEIQFDYLRFPDAKGLLFSAPNTEINRVGAVSGFLAAARSRLSPDNVFISADIFGYVLWNENDTSIGQKLEAITDKVDYISPMLYPTGFQFGIPGYANPVTHPFEIVQLSMNRAIARTHLAPERFRPWLQAFPDYAFDRRVFGAEQIRAQIDAAERSGSGGWMLWNPHNTYRRDGLADR